MNFYVKICALCARFNETLNSLRKIRNKSVWKSETKEYHITTFYRRGSRLVGR